MDRDFAPTPTSGAFSIYHEKWWLDAATDGKWGEVAVRDGDVHATMIFTIEHRFGQSICRLPSLIRTLGPVIPPLPGKPVTVLRRRLEITHALLDQLPKFAFFEQVFDPRITDAAAFAHRDGYVIGSAYAFRLPADHDRNEIWSGMADKTRNVIRTAAHNLDVAPIAGVGEFCDFHTRCLGGESNHHGNERMRTLLRAVHIHQAGLLLGARTAQGELAAAVALVWDESVMYYLLATRRPELAGPGGVSLLIWHGIQMACDRGLAFDFDGATSPGMLMFLSGFGGTMVQRLRIRRATASWRVLSIPARFFGRAL